MPTRNRENFIKVKPSFSALTTSSTKRSIRVLISACKRSARFFFQACFRSVYNNRGRKRERIFRFISRIFNGIEYSFFEDGEKYIGIAYSNGNDCEVPLYEGEERLPQGYWFVDKNGKIISGRFDHLPYSIENIEEPLIVEDEEGNKIEINVKDYLLEA